MTSRHPSQKAAARLHVLLVVALCVFGVTAAMQGSVEALALAVLAVIAALNGTWASLGAAIVALLFGGYAIAAVVAADALTHYLASLGPMLAGSKPDPAALTQHVAALPDQLFAQLRAVAGSGPVTTRELILAAKAGDFRRVPLGGEDPGGGAFDGPLLDDGRGGACSQYAAEAIAMAQLLAERSRRPLNAELLATCAVAIPLSAAAHWAGAPIGGAEPGAGVSSQQLFDALHALSETGAGGDVLRRVQIVTELGPMASEEPTRANLAAATQWQLLKLQALLPLATLWAIVAVLVEIPVDLAGWIVRLPGRAARALPRAVRRLSRRGPRARTASLRQRGARLLAPWSQGPRWAWALWLALRPALAFAAIAVAGAQAGAACLIVAAIVLVRPLRRYPLAWLAAAAAAAVSVEAAALLAVRAAAGEVALRGLGWGSSGSARSGGVACVIAARRRLTARVFGLEASDLESAKAAFAKAIAERPEDEDELLERAAGRAAAALAEARPGELLRAIRIGALGALFGTWPGAGGTGDAFGELRRLYIQEAAGTWLARWSVLGGAAALAAIAFPHGSGILGGADWTGRASAAVAVLLIASPLTDRAPRVFSAFLGALVSWLLLGSEVLPVAGVAVVATLLARQLRSRAEGLVLAGRRRWRDWPPPKRSLRRPRLRRLWHVAETALEEGREPIAVELFSQLAGSRGASDELATVALVRASLLEIERGRLESAAAKLDEVGERREALPDAAAVAAGILSAALGDLEDAENQLRAALDRLDEGSPLRPRASLRLADVLGRRGKPQEAIAVLSRLRQRPLAIQGMDAWIDTEVEVAAALAAGGSRREASARLDELVSHPIAESMIGSPGPRQPGTYRRIGQAEARALVLRARLAVEDGRGQEAEPLLRRALDLLPEEEGGSLRAVALVLFGVASVGGSERASAVESMRAGIEELEGRRTQLRAGGRRTAMIVADEQLYSLALKALSHAGRLGDGAAGEAGATLIESLRRNAIASTLQRGSLELGERALALIGEIAEAEQRRGDVDDLRADLGQEVSRRFASAYLPEAVAPARLRETAKRYGHVLSFFMPPGELRGWRAWTAPDGEMRIDRVDLSQGAAAEALDENGMRGDLIHAPIADRAETWAALARALLPEDLRTAVAAAPVGWPEKLLVIPDGVVSLIPWAALWVDGKALLELAVVQVAPTVELTPEHDWRRLDPTSKVVAHADRTPGELEPLEEICEIEAIDSRRGFVEALRSRRFGGAYLAMHGRETGLRQHIEFPDGSTLSAATALACPWPPWVVFATCLVGRVEQIAGQEPLGLAISCMLRGADTVLASVLEITDGGAAAVCGPLAARLASGRNPAEALRDFQLAYLRTHPLASAASCLGLICISTTAPTPFTIRGAEVSSSPLAIAAAGASAGAG